MMEKRVLITGGTKGIGRAVAECLAKAGYSLILTYASDKEEALRVADGLLQQYKVEVLTLQADISDRKSIEKIESFLTGCSMRLDAVIFNAGLTCRDSFEDLDIVEWERVFFANVHFPVFLLQRIVGLINKGGSIVFTGSLMGIQPHSVSLVYGVTKSAVHALVKNMVKFLVPYELRVNAVAPGFVDTEWQKTKPAEIRRNIENKVSLGRFCDPEELAEVYRMLVENSYFRNERELFPDYFREQPHGMEISAEQFYQLLGGEPKHDKEKKRGEYTVYDSYQDVVNVSMFGKFVRGVVHIGLKIILRGKSERDPAFKMVKMGVEEGNLEGLIATSGGIATPKLIDMLVYNANKKYLQAFKRLLKK